MQNGVYDEENICIWDISMTKGYFSTKFFSMFIIYQGLSFGGIYLKVELVLFVYELIIYL